MGWARSWLALLLVWVVVCGPVGVVMYLVTTFLFAFSGGQYRMVPIVDAGPWTVAGAALLLGAVSLVATRSLLRAVQTLVVSTAAGWLLAGVVYWVLSFWLGAA